MRYMLQVMAMISDLAIFTAIVVVTYMAFLQHSIVLLLVAGLGLWSWNKTGIFFAWKPKNIKQFLANAKKMGL